MPSTRRYQLRRLSREPALETAPFHDLERLSDTANTGEGNGERVLEFLTGNEPSGASAGSEGNAQHLQASRRFTAFHRQPACRTFPDIAQNGALSLGAVSISRSEASRHPGKSGNCRDREPGARQMAADRGSAAPVRGQFVTPVQGCTRAQYWAAAVQRRRVPQIPADCGNGPSIRVVGGES
jgi:hypothetical protein